VALNKFFISRSSSKNFAAKTRQRSKQSREEVWSPYATFNVALPSRSFDNPSRALIIADGGDSAASSLLIGLKQ